MSKLVNQWIDLFRAGDHGDKGAFTEHDLHQIAANYDPANHEAPAVIGHPKTDGPAYGWFDKLRVAGNLLQGAMRQADPAFEEAVQAGRFKKRSVSLYKGANGWSLRHVGFLGAQPPEIKGLADIKFEQADAKAIEIEFSETQEDTEMAELKDADKQSIVDGVVEKIKAFVHGKPGETAVPKTFSEEDVTRIAAKAAADAIAPVQAKLEAQATEFAEAKKVQHGAGTRQRAADAIAKLKAEGKWVPAFDKMGVAVVFDELAKSNEAVEFGEGDAKKQTTGFDLLVSFMEGIGKIVPSGEIYTGQTSKTTRANMQNVNETRLTGADPNSIRLHEFAEAYSTEHKVSYGDALTQMTKAHPELTQPGGSTAGAV